MDNHGDCHEEITFALIASLARSEPEDSASVLDRIVRVCDAIYRFLASLKLAVFSLATLAAVLAYATFFESWYGAAAVQEWIYRTRGFAHPARVPGDEHPLRGPDPLPLEEAADRVRDHPRGLLILLAGSW